ncbi:MAG TPA: (2Fe-2S)-binding protein [Bacteriovoracaceae bacterium]|nr:(2Fe-2S)-binding protein [Bacteriovoracaceae bacterium]
MEEEEFIQLIDEIGDLLSPNDLLDDDILICECFCVNVADIRHLFQDSKTVDLDALAKAYGLGQGCQSCLKRKDWIDRIF